jgi:hypothetical protein
MIRAVNPNIKEMQKLTGVSGEVEKYLLVLHQLNDLTGQVL